MPSRLLKMGYIDVSRSSIITRLLLWDWVHYEMRLLMLMICLTCSITRFCNGKKESANGFSTRWRMNRSSSCLNSISKDNSCGRDVWNRIQSSISISRSFICGLPPNRNRLIGVIIDIVLRYIFSFVTRSQNPPKTSIMSHRKRTCFELLLIDKPPTLVFFVLNRSISILLWPSPFDFNYLIIYRWRRMQ